MTRLGRPDAAAPTQPARLDVPAGDPQAVAGVAARMRAVSVAVVDARDECAGLPHAWAAAWRGVTASAAQESVLGLGHVVGTAVGPFDIAAAALELWGRALADAQAEIGRLQRLADDLAADAAARRRSLVIEVERAEAESAASGRLPTYAYGGSPDQWGMPRARLDHHDAAAAQEQGGLRQRADAVLGQLDTVALEVRRALEQTRPLAYRGHRESLSDWGQRAASDVLALVPGLDEHPETVRAGVWAFMTAPQFGVVGVQVVRRSINVLKAIRPAEDGAVVEITASRLPWGLRLLLRRQTALATLLARNPAIVKGLVGTAPTQNLWSVGRAAAATGPGGLRGAASAGQAVARGAGWLRGAGIVGGVAATGVSAANVISQGNPVDAFRENGAGYVSDVAELGFNASSTAFLIAPNPATAGAMVVTGTVWAGAELVDHWDDVTQLASDGLDTVADAADAAVEGLSTAGEAVGDAASTVGGWLNPFD